MIIRLACNIQSDSIVDGEGIRTVIWTQGCPHRCLGCHNPETHDFNGGFATDTDNIIKQLQSLDMQDGITLSGGDPFFQPAACAIISEYAHNNDLTVWCYTGYTFEELLELSISDKDILRLMNSIDVLIDGKFDLEKKSLDIRFRGSTNQRVIDLPKSLNEGKVVLHPKHLT